MAHKMAWKFGDFQREVKIFLPEFVEDKQEKDVYSCRRIKTKLKITQPQTGVKKTEFCSKTEKKFNFENSWFYNFVNFNFVFWNNFEFSRNAFRFSIENYSKIAPHSSAIFACPAPFVFQQNSPKNWANFRLKFYWAIYQQTKKIQKTSRISPRRPFSKIIHIAKESMLWKKNQHKKQRQRESLVSEQQQISSFWPHFNEIWLNFTHNFRWVVTAFWKR